MHDPKSGRLSSLQRDCFVRIGRRLRFLGVHLCSRPSFRSHPQWHHYRHPTGAVIASVQVSIRNQATAEVRNASADGAGFDSAPNLLPGKYDVTISAPAFATTIQKYVTLTGRLVSRCSISKSKEGQVNETVEVSDLPPAIDLATSTISGVVNE